jgi:hypothetical protein
MVVPLANTLLPRQEANDTAAGWALMRQTPILRWRHAQKDYRFKSEKLELPITDRRCKNLSKRQRQLPVEGGGDLFFAVAVEGVAGAEVGDELGDAVLIILREVGGMPEEFAAVPNAHH